MRIPWVTVTSHTHNGLQSWRILADEIAAYCVEPFKDLHKVNLRFRNNPSWCLEGFVDAENLAALLRGVGDSPPPKEKVKVTK